MEGKLKIEVSHLLFRWYVSFMLLTRVATPWLSESYIDLLRYFSWAGLGWHLPGLSQFPPEYRLLLLLAGPFQLFFAFYAFLYLCFLNFIFSVFSVVSSFVKFWTVYVVFRVSKIFSCSTASTAIHSAITLAPSSKPNTCRSEYISKEVCTYNMHAASGCFPGAWSSWHLQVACLYLKLLDHLLHLLLCSILPCERA